MQLQISKYKLAKETRNFSLFGMLFGNSISSSSLPNIAVIFFFIFALLGFLTMVYQALSFIAKRLFLDKSSLPKSHSRLSSDSFCDSSVVNYNSSDYSSRFGSGDCGSDGDGD
ncbi:MAG: hypothetical protein HC786_09145 [Richelia sp. CSU_2_1]|nr:hypothetical protein [Microcoleus sp. SU_5_6]NJR22305.1 hypothetical protein [Richelia sp. CSU_2_1]